MVNRYIHMQGMTMYTYDEVFFDTMHTKECIIIRILYTMRTQQPHQQSARVLAQSSLRCGYNNRTVDALELEWTGNAETHKWLEFACTHMVLVHVIHVSTNYCSPDKYYRIACMHDLQLLLLRWGQEPLPPPRLTYQEYEEVCGWICFHSNSKALGRHEASLFIAATYDAIFYFLDTD